MNKVTLDSLCSLITSSATIKIVRRQKEQECPESKTMILFRGTIEELYKDEIIEQYRDYPVIGLDGCEPYRIELYDENQMKKYKIKIK